MKIDYLEFMRMICVNCNKIGKIDKRTFLCIGCLDAFYDEKIKLPKTYIPVETEISSE